VPVPSEDANDVTWYKWTDAANAAAGKNGAFAMAIDRSGRTFVAPAISII
jgi:hypothetical protein